MNSFYAHQSNRKATVSVSEYSSQMSLARTVLVEQAIFFSRMYLALHKKTTLRTLHPSGFNCNP